MKNYVNSGKAKSQDKPILSQASLGNEEGAETRLNVLEQNIGIQERVATIQEEWKIIPEFPRYQISNLGRCLGPMGRILKIASFFNSPYAHYKLRKENLNKEFHVKAHRLVAQAFVENLENKSQVNHIDGNKINNIFTNLEWCTPKENIRHAWETGLCKKQLGENTSSASITNEQALMVITLLDAGKSYTEVFKLTNVNKNIIGKIKRGVRWSHLRNNS